MVFNSAEASPADSGYTSFLSRLGNRTTSTVTSRPLPKPTISSASKPPPSTMSKPPATTQTGAAKPNGTTAVRNDVNGLKRKAEEDLSRPSKVQETTKSGSATTKPATVSPAEPAKAPKKGSYMELLQRAKTAPKVPAGAIVNKPKIPAEPMKKKWQKKLEKEQQRAARAAAGRKSKSPGTASGGEKAGVKVVDKGPLAKKPGVDTAGPSKKVAPGPLDKKSTTSGAGVASSSKPKASAVDPRARTTATIREKERSPPARRGSRDDHPARGARASVYDRPRPVGGKRYVYREETDSDSDMEATGIDILEEEEISAKRARLEDIEQERLEKKLAAEKAARKKAMIGKK